MKLESFAVDGREVVHARRGQSGVLLVQPVDEHDLAGLEAEADALAAQTGALPFALAAFRVADGNDELSPWLAPPVFGDAAFGGGAPRTLAWVEETLLPALGARDYARLAVGGYSLAGLFALYAAWTGHGFDGAAGVSPSVWFPGWTAFATAQPSRAGSVYLSLGDREEHTRHPVMRTVGDELRALQRRLDATAGVRCCLEWNPGNHFREPALRTAKGLSWLVRTLSE